MDLHHLIVLMVFYQASSPYLLKIYSSFSIIFTVKSIYLSSEKTEMLFGSTKFHTNQKDLIILQFYKHLCSFSKFKEIDCKDKIASNILKLWSVPGKHMLKPLFLLKLLTQVVCADNSQSLITRTRQRYNFSRVIIDIT